MRGSPSSQRRRSRRLRLLTFLGTALVLTGFVLAAYAADVLDDSELDTVDARFAIRGELAPPEDIVIVGIDDPSITELAERWPFPRTLHAEAIKQLRADGARVIGYDVQFTEPSENPDDDQELADAIAQAGNVVLATTIVDDRGRTNVFGGDEILRTLNSRAAHAGYATDSGRVVRRMAHDLEKLDTLAVAIVERAQRRQVPKSEFPEERPWIDYHGKSNIETIPFYRVVRGDFPKGTFEDKIVIVGATSPILQDVHPTSVSGDDYMFGVEVLANSVSTLLRDFPLRGAPAWTAVALILLFGAVGPLIAIRFGPLRAALIGLGLAILYALFVQIMFNAGVIVGFLYPLASLAFGVVGALAVAVVLNAFERQRVRDLFSRFVPEPVVDDVLRNVDEGLRLGFLAQRLAGEQQLGVPRSLLVRVLAGLDHSGRDLGELRVLRLVPHPGRQDEIRLQRGDLLEAGLFIDERLRQMRIIERPDDAVSFLAHRLRARQVPRQ